MRFEDRYFRRKVPDPEKLKAYGFRQETDGCFKYEKLLREQTFRAELTVDPAGAVRGKLIDLEFGDEFYQIHSDSQRGAFVAEISEEYGAFLANISKACFIAQPFAGPQANRIARQIRAEFGERPDFPFEKYEGAGVFRNPDNRKWYGLIMEVDRKKLKKPGEKGPNASGEEPVSEPVEALNVKVLPETVPDLVRQKGIYECHHMNKKHWVTVALDDEVPDEQVLSLLRESRGFTLGKGKARGRRKDKGGKEGPRKWMMPANVYRYDVPAALERDSVLLWKHGSRTKPGDLVYLYFSAPVSGIRYQFRVVESDIDYHFSDEKMNERGEKAMRMELLEEFEPPFPLSEMRKLGIGSVRGPRYIPEELENALLRTGRKRRRKQDE